jgi:hypothetical protein
MSARRSRRAGKAAPPSPVFFPGEDGTAGGLRFGDYGTVNLNLFANLADRFGGAKAPNG